MIKKIISGGQTGGWISRGRKAEDGPLPGKYKLKELTTSSYPVRTEKNVLDSDGTLIITHGPLTGGSKLTHTRIYGI